MVTWQVCLVALGVTTVLCGIIGCFYYYYRTHYPKMPIENDEEQYDSDSHSCSMNVNEKKLGGSSSYLDLTIVTPASSPSPPFRGAGPPSCLTELSAPPIHFFLRSNPSRQVPLPPPVACAALNDAKDIRRCLSLSPFLGQKPPTPDTSIVDSHTPTPALSKITTSLSSWKRKS